MKIQGAGKNIMTRYFTICTAHQILLSVDYVSVDVMSHKHEKMRKAFKVMKDYG
jgi:hypothetical protein